MRRRVPLAVVMVVVLRAATANAQDVQPMRVTLEEAQARALDASHRIAEARARETTAQALVDAQRAADRPNVALQAGYRRTNHVTPFVVFPAGGAPELIYPDIVNNYRSRLDLQWPIYTGGRADALEQSARAEAAATAAEVAVAQSDLKLETARAYWAVVTAAQAVRVLDTGVARAQAHVMDVRARFDAGLVPPNEIASAEAQESRERMLLIEARNQRDVASADLARLIGVSALTTFEPTATLEGLPQVAAIDTLVATALNRRDERTVLQRRIESAQEQETAAAAGRRPAVLVLGGYDYSRPNTRFFPISEAFRRSWDAGVSMVWPLWDSGRTAADVAQAAGVTGAARERLAEFDSVLAVDVRQRALEIDSGRAAVAAADDAVRAAAEARRVVNERYNAGVISQIEVLDADFALLQAELDRTRTLANVRLAEARLARAIGQ